MDKLKLPEIAVVCNHYGLRFLEELGGINKHNYKDDNPNLVFYINNLGIIEKESKERYELYCFPIFDTESVEHYHRLLSIMNVMMESEHF